MASKPYATPEYDSDSYAVRQDADALQKHAEITSDPKRHKAALDHLSARNDVANTAETYNRKLLEKKTKSRLKQAFDSKAATTNGDKEEEE